MRRLLVAFQETRFNKGSAALGTLVLPQNALVGFELSWVCTCPTAAATTKPPLGGRRVWL